MPGPPPTPTAILRSRGSWRADTRKDEPNLKLSKPRKPKGLSRSAAKRFRKVATDLYQMGVSSEKDEGALVRYCNLWDQYDLLTKNINELGTVFRGDDDNPKTRPEFLQWMKISDALLKIEREFGLTPSARTRIRTVGIEEKADDRPSLSQFKIGN